LKFEKKFLAVGILLSLVYFLTRLFHLTIVPVFCDEAIYIRWSQVMRAESSLRFLPLSDGKQPLFMWLTIPLLKIFNGPLIAGRMVSVLAGLGTLIGVWLLSYLLIKKKELSLFASILYIFTPFTLFFDRMALVDGLLSCFGIWFLIFAVLLANSQRLDLAMIGGIILGLSLLTKSPALFFALLLPLTIMSARRPLGGTKMKMVALLIFYWLVIYLFGFAIYNILRLGPEFHMIAIRNKDYVFSFSEVLRHPFSPLLGNLRSVAEWYWVLLTPPVFILGILGIPLLIKKDFKIGLFLLLWWLLPLLGQSAIAKVYTARYVLFSIPLFLIFSSFFVSEVFLFLKNKIFAVVFLAVVLLLPIYQSVLLLVSPQRAWLPRNERSGYLEEWTAGYGIKEAAEYIKNAVKTQKVLVGTEGYFGTLPDGLQIYLEKIPNTTIIGIGYPIKEISPKLIDSLKDNRVFLLVNDTRFLVTSGNMLKLIASYPKAINPESQAREHLLFYEITH